MSAFLLFIAGGVILLGGADLLVRGSVKIADIMRLSALFVGLVIVALGTSLPELAVSVASGCMGKDDIALGNVVGSNIANVFLILGLSAILCGISVNRQVLRFDLPVMLASSMVLAAAAGDGTIDIWEGALFFAAFVLYISISYRRGKSNAPCAPGAPEKRATGLIKPSLFLAVGLVGVVGGAYVAVSGAAMLARAWGVGELIIGLTVVALGTSLPELATSIVAAAKRQGDIAVGNVVGSNIANILCIVGLSALASGKEGLAVQQTILVRDLPVMLLVMAVCFVVCVTGRKVSRWEGLFLLLGYGVYLVYGITSALKPEALVWVRIVAGLYAVAGLFELARLVFARLRTADA